MKIAVIGATGTAGRPTVDLARAAGHEVRPLSRSTGVDLQTGDGLAAGLTGAEVVINTSNAVVSREGIEENFAEVTARLATACLDAGVPRLVHLSICNIDDPGFDDFDYYRAKRAQERVLAASALKTTIIRSAQWMEFALNPGAVTMSEDRVEVEDWLVQPLAVAEVARVLVEAASAASPDRQVAGPEAIRLPDLTRGLLAARGDARPVVAVKAAIPAFSSGILLAPDGAELLGPTPAEWVARQGS